MKKLWLLPCFTFIVMILVSYVFMHFNFLPHSNFLSVLRQSTVTAAGGLLGYCLGTYIENKRLTKKKKAGLLE
jgi:hypothetical protein